MMAWLHLEIELAELSSALALDCTASPGIHRGLRSLPGMQFIPALRNRRPRWFDRLGSDADLNPSTVGLESGAGHVCLGAVQVFEEQRGDRRGQPHGLVQIAPRCRPDGA